MGTTLTLFGKIRRNAADLREQAAIAGIEAFGFRWSPGGVLVVRVTESSPASEVVCFRRLAVRLEGFGVRCPSWLTLAVFPETIWQSEGPVVVFWLDGIPAERCVALFGVTEEMGWSVLHSLNQGDSVYDAVLFRSMGAVPVAASGRWQLHNKAVSREPNAIALGGAAGHAAAISSEATATLDAGNDPLTTVPAWVAGNAYVVFRSLAFEFVSGRGGAV